MSMGVPGIMEPLRYQVRTIAIVSIAIVSIAIVSIAIVSIARYHGASALPGAHYSQEDGILCSSCVPRTVTYT
jgi:hypothetical protein